MATVGEISVNISAEAAAFMSKMDAASEKLSKVSTSAAELKGGMEKLTDRADRAGQVFTVLGKSLAALAAFKIAADGAKSFGESVFEAAAKTDRLKATLVTVTGSADLAAREFARLSDFSAATPFFIEQVTEAFIKLRIAGLDASERAMRSFGDTASAMSKPLMQLVEAIADAVNGQFARLNEFGIDAQKQGDKIKFTFAGVTETVKNTSEDIVKYFIKIGETKFSGGMERQAVELGGKFDTLKDKVSQLYSAIGNAGVTDGMKSLIDWASDLTDSLTNAVNEFSRLNNYEKTKKYAADTAEAAAKGGAKSQLSKEGIQTEIEKIEKRIREMKEREKLFNWNMSEDDISLKYKTRSIKDQFTPYTQNEEARLSEIRAREFMKEDEIRRQKFQLEQTNPYATPNKEFYAEQIGKLEGELAGLKEAQKNAYSATGDFFDSYEEMAGKMVETAKAYNRELDLMDPFADVGAETSGGGGGGSKRTRRSRDYVAPSGGLSGSSLSDFNIGGEMQGPAQSMPNEPNLGFPGYWGFSGEIDKGGILEEAKKQYEDEGAAMGNATESAALSLKNLGKTIDEALPSAIENAIKSVKKVDDIPKAFGNMVKDLLTQISGELTSNLIKSAFGSGSGGGLFEGLLGSISGGGGGGGGGFLSSIGGLFSGLFGAAAGGGGFAAGGALSTAAAGFGGGAELAGVGAGLSGLFMAAKKQPALTGGGQSAASAADERPRSPASGVTIQVSTPDANSFRRSQAQINRAYVRGLRTASVRDR